MSNLNKQITFLFPPNERNDEAIIGIRYYKNNWRESKDGYFTLVKKNENRYEILENLKNNVKDIEGNSFFINKLNCEKIIENVIFNKYLGNYDFILGLSLIELLGFIYSAKENSIKKCIITGPFMPNPLEKQSYKESFDSEPHKNVLYLRPLLYLNHVSILLFILKENNERKNVLLDISLFHIKYFEKDNFFFPKEMKQNLLIVPKCPIQLGEACGLWFISQVNYIMENGMNAFNELCEINIEYLLKIINNISDLLNISKFLKIKNINERKKRR